MKKLYFCLNFIILFLLGLGSAQSASVRIDTPKIELELSPGESFSGEIVAENTADEELKVRLYVEDWKYKPSGKGDKDFFPAGSLDRSASPWIAFTPPNDVMKPFGKVVARYTIKVPEGVAGAYYSVLFFETILGSAQQEDGSNVLVAGRIGALFLIHVKGTVQKVAAIEDVKVAPPQGNAPLIIQTTLSNTGNIEVVAQGKFLAMDASGKVVARGNLEPLYTQPGQKASRDSEWVGRLEPGSYQAILTYDLGQGDIRTEERAFTVA